MPSLRYRSSFDPTKSKKAKVIPLRCMCAHESRKVALKRFTRIDEELFQLWEQGEGPDYLRTPFPSNLIRSLYVDSTIATTLLFSTR
jgi:hypothetical protein